MRQRTYDKGRILEKLDVRKQYSQIYFITINCVEFHSYIYIYILTPFFKLDRPEEGWTPTRVSPTSNSRGIGGIPP